MNYCVFFSFTNRDLKKKGLKRDLKKKCRVFFFLILFVNSQKHSDNYVAYLSLIGAKK